MGIFRAVDNVPSVYSTESRDFQLFLRVLDFVQNSIKYDIDTMIYSLSTEDAPSHYLERLKSKVGFYNSHEIDDKALRLALIVFPFIIRYKGSVEGIKRCVNAYLRHLGIRDPIRLNIYNAHPTHPYTIKIGIPSRVKDTFLLEDLLSYILPTGYFVEMYLYENVTFEPTESVVNFDYVVLSPYEEENTSVRADRDNNAENITYSTVQLGNVYDPSNINTTIEESDITNE